MISELPTEKITFYELTNRLRAFIRLRINSGEFSERALARILRISQPHLHNMLKGVRHLSVEFADRLMLKLNISVMDLIPENEMRNFLGELIEKTPAESAKRKKPPLKSDRREREDRTPWKDSRNSR